MNKQIFIDKGRLLTEEVPLLTCRAGEVTVNVMYSAFSSGTEFGELAKSSLSLLARARKSPEKISKAIEMIKTAGIKSTINFVEDSQLSLQATGYSLVGKITSVGEGISDLAVGDVIACSGAQFAHHAFQVKVSRQLCAKLPLGLSSDLASTVTLGAIAMQGVRQANVSIGERVAVIGLGVIGQIATQILLAAGAQVTGLDLDIRKLQLSSDNGIQSTIDANSEDILDRSLELTGGDGFDKVLICASDPSSASAKLAFEVARHRGTVVMIGGIGLDLDRRLMYNKELNFVASMSYGPGRYERSYEEKGLDLPIAYVRWTENRNMISYLDVVKSREEAFRNLIGHVVPFDDAVRYLNSDESKGLDRPLIIIEYNDGASTDFDPFARVTKHEIAPLNKNVLQLGVLGVGGFAKTFTLPILSKIKNCNVGLISSSDNASIVNIRKKYNINLGVSNVNEALQHKLDAYIVANRHSEHFDTLKTILLEGKSVFIEKPTVNKVDELNSLIEIFSSKDLDNCIVYTGYNRVFSPHIKFVKEQLNAINAPIMASYQMNAGQLKKDNWQYDIEEGGRNIGEAVHIYHLFSKLFESTVKSLSVSSINGNELYKPGDNFTVTIRYENGCLGTLNYSSLGSSKYPKESFVIHSGGKTITSENYKNTQVVGGKSFNTALSEKGHKEVLESFVDSVLMGVTHMSREEQVETMRVAFYVESELRGN
ncbi:bi-domain-containing oxidoreductase [Gammaproteobacteria bacterium]|nr:bi-domain-containing oxidoreductase [Gammaproteobacteria bacterium]